MPDDMERTEASPPEIWITGGAGFIGSHLVERMLGRGHRVVVIDDFDPFYPPEIKRANVAPFLGHTRFRLVEADVRDLHGVERALEATGTGNPEVVVHLAARSGVRASLADPLLYSSINLGGTTAVLELTRRRGARRLVFASSSSVYGAHARIPFSEDDPADAPLSPYAATKRGAELLCRASSHLYGISTVCLRLFTVYGPRQRPDLAVHAFARRLVEGRPIPMYGGGHSERDYTYVEDVVNGIEGAIRYTGEAPGAFEVVNLGSGRATTLRRLIDLLAAALGREARIERLPSHPGDVERTLAEIDRAHRLFGYTPRVPIEEGVRRFVEWLQGR